MLREDADRLDGGQGKRRTVQALAQFAWLIRWGPSGEWMDYDLGDSVRDGPGCGTALIVGGLLLLRSWDHARFGSLSDKLVPEERMTVERQTQRNAWSGLKVPVVCRHLHKMRFVDKILPLLPVPESHLMCFFVYLPSVFPVDKFESRGLDRDTTTQVNALDRPPAMDRPHV